MKQTFLRDIRTTFGSGGFVCSLSDKELSEFHQFMENSFSFEDRSKVKKGLQWVGQQPDGIWVLNEGVHINQDGT